MPKTVIVIPTYNERNNIKLLIEKLFALPLENIHILVVDDNSPDGTGKVVDELKLVYGQLDVLHRQGKAGLGTAYLAGFKHALSDGADLIMEMDADFSHDPKHIPEFLEAAKKYQLVLGSRYISGGGIRNWNLARRLVSRGGNIYARTLLGLPIRDLTGGFKCYRREVLEKIDLDGLSSVGYNFQIESTYRVFQGGFSIKEIPITFTERTEGKSKFNPGIMLESFWKVLLLKFSSRKKR